MQNMTTNQQKINFLESAFGNSQLANSGLNITVVCPVCKINAKNNSGKKKLSIDLATGVYHCWVCESKGKNVGSLIRKYANLSKDNLTKIYELFNFNLSTNDKTQEEKILNLPKDFELLYTSKSKSAKFAIDYLLNRGLNTDDFLKFKIGISRENDFINRVIFPSFCDNLNLNFYLSRTYDSQQKIKYRNCDGKRKDIIFNEYFINWNKPVILVEGVFDSIKAGDNSIPILGSWIDEEHYIFRKLVIEGSDIILGMDPDAYEKTLKIAEKFSEYGNNVKITQHKSTDFGDMTKEEVKFWIDNAKIYEQTDRMTYLIQSITSGSIF